MTVLNLQRNSEVFFSTISLADGQAPTAMQPVNTWKLEILAGFTASASTATQDITAIETGNNPDRSQQRFNTAINPVEWNFQTYLRPTGARATNQGASGGLDSNARPVADWFMWQALTSNTAFAEGSSGQSVFRTGGLLFSDFRAGAANAAPSRSNFASSSEYYAYIKLDNIIYQVSNAVVNQATVDAGLDEIATVTWSGFGASLRELAGSTRDNAISVFGGINNAGTFVAGNANAASLTVAASYHPFNIMTHGGSASTNSFLRNRLSLVEVTHATSATATPNTYSFPITALSFDINNNITFLTPEEISNLNTPIGHFTGAKSVSGSMTMYLRGGDSQSAQFMRNIMNDSRPATELTTAANIWIGGKTAPYVQIRLDAVQFDFPQLAVEDVIGLTVNYVAQEPLVDLGQGGEYQLAFFK